ncbi:MAG: glycosyltransferase [Candidatus Omnitrophota bacterium]|nr:glycosyltransferase [Candidatus Omnitrophota bacterium]
MPENKRIILMYITEISGHHSATLAVEKAIRSINPRAEILNINAFNYTNPISEKVINRLYMSVIKRTPQIWEYLYDNPVVAQNLEGIKEAIHKFNSNKLQKLFDNFRPDVVACTQAFPCGMVADYKKTTGSILPLVAILTDYIPHSYWIYDTVNAFVSPAEEVSARLIQKGVDPEKINTLGIPFDNKFNNFIDKTQVRRALGLDPSVFTILIMGGGQGLGPIKKIVKSLEKTSKPVQEIIVTGTNKKIYKSLKHKVKDSGKKIKLLGYANNVNELMSASDIIITKPGGITTAEALAKKLPIIIIKPIPGQEANNTAYLTAMGAAIKLDFPQDINLVIDDLISNPAKLSGLRQAVMRISKPNASMDTAKLLLNLSNV